MYLSLCVCVLSNTSLFICVHVFTFSLFLGGGKGGQGWTNVEDSNGTSGFAPTNYLEIVSEEQYRAHANKVVPSPVYVAVGQGEEEIENAYAEVNYEDIRRSTTV